MTSAAALHVDGGCFGYAGRVVVQADLDVAEGDVVALLGANGSGKTTLVKGILGLVDQHGGTVEVFGHSLDGRRDLTAVGYVPQRQSAAGPIPVTVIELVRSGRLTGSTIGRRRRRVDDDAVDWAIDAVGLGPFRRRPVAALSGGQQRRALVARALAGGAQLLLLDEPLAGVDQTNQQAMADALAGLVDRGVTIVVVLHELGPLEPLVTRAVVMDLGRIVFDGPLATAPPHLLHLGHDHDPHGGPEPRVGIGLRGS